MKQYIALISIITVCDIGFIYTMYSENLRHSSVFLPLYLLLCAPIPVCWCLLAKSPITGKDMLYFVAASQIVEKTAGIIIPWLKVSNVNILQIIGLIIAAIGSGLIFWGGHK